MDDRDARAIAERLVRGLIEFKLKQLLDSGNNKKVVADVDKLLKKQPSFICAKVLKALALIRLNKVREARQILDPVVDTAPTDDGTIQALSICYRELDEPSSLCNIMEAACKKEQSEELLTHCFMAQVRVQDYQKQHLTALTLYKTFNKATYFSWAIASLIVKYQMNPPNEKSMTEMLPLQLAERMCDKFFAEKQQVVKDVSVDAVPPEEVDTSILGLYFQTLTKLKNWEKLLRVLADHGYPKESYASDRFHDVYCNSLETLEKFDELFDYLKSAYMKNLDEYAVLKQLINTFGKLRKDAVNDYLMELRKTHPSRTVALADLLYITSCNIKDCKLRVQEDLKMVIKYGADKLSFFSDLTDYFQLLSQMDVGETLKLLDPSNSREECNYDTVAKVISDVNFEMVHREIIPITTPYYRLKRAERCFGKYLVCEKAKEALRNDSNMRTKESDYHDQFIVIAASALIAEYFNHAVKNRSTVMQDILQHKLEWLSIDDYPKEVQEMRSKLINSEGGEDDHEVAQDVDSQLSGKESIFLLLTAASLLEYGLESSPHNYSMRVLLAQLYTRFGAGAAALKVTQQLDLKHVQWDTLGYLNIFDSVNSGLYQHASKMFVTAENMYSGYKRESMEHVITAYKYGSFTMIKQFLDFRSQLLDSSQCALVFCEKRLLDYLISCSQPGELKKVAETISNELHPRMLLKMAYTDNRDFTVLQGLAEDVNLDELKKVTSEIDIQFYKIRITLLFSLTKMVTLLDKLDIIEERTNVVAYITAFEKYVQMWEELLPLYERQYQSEPLLYGVWPTRCQKYHEMSIFKLLRDLLVYYRGMVTSENVDQHSWDGFKHLFEDGVKAVIGHLSPNTDLTNSCEESKFCALSELAIDPGITELHFVLETLSFMRIILECAVKIDERRASGLKSDIKKKGRMTLMLGHKRQHVELTAMLREGVNSVISFTDHFRKKYLVCDFKHTVLNSTKLKKLMQPGFLVEACGKVGDAPLFGKVLENIEYSFKVQLEEIRKIAIGLAENLKHLQD